MRHFFFADTHDSRLHLAFIVCEWVCKHVCVCAQACLCVNCVSVHSNEGVISLPRVLRALPPSDPYLPHSPPSSHSNLCSSLLPASPFADHTHINRSIYNHDYFKTFF